MPPPPPPVEPPATAPPAALPRYVSVSGDEFRLSLSRPLVGAGSVTIEFRNVGEDPHDLNIRRVGSAVALDPFGEVLPGSLAKGDRSLAAGQYYLWCSLLDHESLGMSAYLQVR